MPSRRTFLQLSLAAGLGTGLGLPLGLTRADEPGRWLMPDEGEPQQRAFIAFGARMSSGKTSPPMCKLPWAA